MTGPRATARSTAKAPEPMAIEREVLGRMDIGTGLPDGAWDSIPSGIPDAMAMSPTWERKTALDKATPKTRHGYVHRWVRIADADGRPDVANKSEALMIGWRPRREGTLGAGERGMPIYDPGDGKGGVIIFKEQLLLCEMREETYRAIQAQQLAAQDQINKTIYQDTRRGSGMPEKYATLEHEGDRESSGLID